MVKFCYVFPPAGRGFRNTHKRRYLYIDLSVIIEHHILALFANMSCCEFFALADWSPKPTVSCTPVHIYFVGYMGTVTGEGGTDKCPSKSGVHSLREPLSKLVIYPNMQGVSTRTTRFTQYNPFAVITSINQGVRGSTHATSGNDRLSYIEDFMNVSLMSAGHLCDLSVLFMRIQNLVTILANLCVTEKTSQK